MICCCKWIEKKNIYYLLWNIYILYLTISSCIFNSKVIFIRCFNDGFCLKWTSKIVESINFFITYASDLIIGLKGSRNFWLLFSISMKSIINWCYLIGRVLLSIFRESILILASRLLSNIIIIIVISFSFSILIII